MTEDQKKCDHDIVWCHGDGLDGMCKKCDLYVMKPECFHETHKFMVALVGQEQMDKWQDD